ncbi:MAG: InlB B-repeat-containing protein, partial [Clostridia bacterium]|nr:InlB B-repeat-containing protein [Clostridia bacterium]
TTEPAAPTTTEPAAPTTTEPAVPTTTEPAAPTTTEPAAPTTTEPAAPTTTEPAAPTTTEPVSLNDDQYPITYYLYNNDSYLSKLEIENKNPGYYTSGTGLQLLNLNVEGYIFDGWFDGQGKNAEQIKRIEKGATGPIELYAHWEPIEYTIMFESDLIPVESQTYTVNRGLVLPTPTLDGYIFAGWSDETGKIIKKIPVGTIGSKQYSANWLSMRNQAWSKQKLDDPIILEDTENNLILFTYEIGEIRNVPSFVIEDFGYINSNGISKTVTKTFSTKVSKSLMNTYTNTVSDSTVNTFGWTLSNAWSDSSTVNEEWAKEHGMTQQEAEEYCKSDTNGWYVSNGTGGSTTTQKLDTKDTYDLNTQTRNGSVGGETSSSVSHAGKISSSYEGTQDAKVEVNAGFSFLGAKDTFSASSKDTFSSSTTDTEERSKSSNFNISGGSSDQKGSVSHTGTNTTNSATWNNESGYNGSSTVTNNKSLARAISDSISNKYGYGKTYIESETGTTKQDFSSSTIIQDTYGSTVTFSAETAESETLTYTTTNTASGYHRWIMVDTAHVFAVVGYDIATSSYFVSTYTVMDNNLQQFEDYSYSTGAYNDNQNSYIDFEVPYDTITEYVGNRVGKSEGLEVNSSGVITAYTGTDNYVVIPEYMVIDNHDGSTSVIQVTGLSEKAFKANSNITGVNLSSFIDEIPANAFRGCSSLKEVQSFASKIGSNAFAECISLDALVLGYGITSIGDNAFTGINDLSIYAINKDVVNAVVNSGAKKITVNVTDKLKSLNNTTLIVPKGTESFTFNGLGKTYKNTSIASDAKKTVINRAKFISTSATPLKLSSEEVVLNQVSVESPGIALLLSADSCDVSLFGDNKISSSYGKTMLCKNVTFDKLAAGLQSNLEVKGDILTAGELNGKSYLKCSGEIIKISAGEFDQYAQGMLTVTFDANGGKVEETSKTVFYGQAYGKLPTPKRKNYTFAGWYTKKKGGEKVTAKTIVSATEKQTLYAHWNAVEFTVTFDANGGVCDESERTLHYGDTYGKLPVPERKYYTFDGWYTEKEGGTQIAENTEITEPTDRTVYAHWTLIPGSDWIKADEVPEDAEIIERKYTYVLTSYTTSPISSLSGWTRYDSSWEWSDYGSWSAWQDSSVSSSESRQVETRYIDPVYKTKYNYYRYVNAAHNRFGTAGYSDCYYLEEISLDYELTYTETHSGIAFYGYYGDYLQAYWMKQGTYNDKQFKTQEQVSPGHTQYRYRDRYKMYTYYYSKTEDMESTTDPTGQKNVSDVVEWVKYRPATLSNEPVSDPEPVYVTKYNYYRYVNADHTRCGTAGYSDCYYLEEISLDYELTYNHSAGGIDFYGDYGTYLTGCWMKKDPFTTKELVSS